MKLFSSMTKKAELIGEIIEEARAAKHAGAFDLTDFTNQLKVKNIGVPYRDARRFWYDWAREAQIWPEGIPADSKTPVDAKSINALIGAFVTSDKYKPEYTKQWDEYSKDPKNIEQFFGATRALRAGKRGIELTKSAEDIRALSPEEMTKRKQEAKEAAAKRTTMDQGKVDITELKLKMLAKFDNPAMMDNLVDHLLDTETDSREEAESIAEDAIETVANAFKGAQSIDEILNSLEEIQSTGTPTAADLAEAAFNKLKKIVTVEDEETSEYQGSQDPEIKKLATPSSQERTEEVYGPEKPDYTEYMEAVKSTKKVVLVENRKMFKPKNIHQLIQRQYDYR